MLQQVSLDKHSLTSLYSPLNTSAVSVLEKSGSLSYRRWLFQQSIRRTYVYNFT